MFAYCKWIYAIISKRGNAMKSRIIKRLICALLAAVLAVWCAVPAFALHNWASSYIIDVHLEHAPEEAAYVDILVPARYFTQKEFEDFHDTDITKYDKPAANIDKNSEIVSFVDDDGFISLSSHSDYIEKIDTHLFEGSMIGSIILKKDDRERDANAVKNHFKQIKIAFIDKDGKVLSVTDEAQFHTVDDQEYPEMTSSGGSELKFGTHKYVSDLEAIIVILLALFAFAACIALAIAIIRGIIKSTVQGIRENKDKGENENGGRNMP